jgi:hypothetical protein
MEAAPPPAMEKKTRRPRKPKEVMTPDVETSAAEMTETSPAADSE